MARRPLSEIVWSQQQVDEIFAAPIREIESSEKPNINVHEKIEEYEKRARLNFNKNRPAPPPPGTQIVLPKIGNYKPKILLSRENAKANPDYKSPYNEVQISEASVSDRQSKVDEKIQDRNLSSSSFKQTTPVHSERVDLNSKCNMDKEEDIYHTIDLKPDYEQESDSKVMIIGDKDVPLVLDTYFGPEDNADDNGTPESQGNDDSKEQVNSDIGISNSDGVVNIGEIVVNPLFDGEKGNDNNKEASRHTYKKRRAPGIPSSYVSRRRSSSQNSHASDDHDEFPYIPAPDYDEDEVTMTFDDFGTNSAPSKSRKPDSKVIKEYEGEDFSKYMADDDDGFHEDVITWRKNIKHTRKPTFQSKQPQIQKAKFTNQKKNVPSKLKPVKKPKHNETQHGSMNQRHTLRDLSYADCKMGLDDRTVRSVKSTTAGGRYVKRGKERTMIVDGGLGGGGYEEFLKMRSKEDGSNSSGDSGLETADDYYGQEQTFYPMQPKKVREKKGNLWEKLTWRFKRHGGGYRMS